MNLSELIRLYGDDKVQFQNLDQCSTNIDWSAKKGSKITFGSEQSITMDRATGGASLAKLGLVIWLDRDHVAKIIADDKAARKNGENADAL